MGVGSNLSSRWEGFVLSLCCCGCKVTCKIPLQTMCPHKSKQFWGSNCLTGLLMGGMNTSLHLSATLIARFPGRKRSLNPLWTTAGSRSGVQAETFGAETQQLLWTSHFFSQNSRDSIPESQLVSLQEAIWGLTEKSFESDWHWKGCSACGRERHRVSLLSPEGGHGGTAGAGWDWAGHRPAPKWEWRFHPLYLPVCARLRYLGHIVKPKPYFGFTTTFFAPLLSILLGVGLSPPPIPAPCQPKHTPLPQHRAATEIRSAFILARAADSLWEAIKKQSNRATFHWQVSRPFKRSPNSVFFLLLSAV